jgi:transposase-like protein
MANRELDFLAEEGDTSFDVFDPTVQAAALQQAALVGKADDEAVLRGGLTTSEVAEQYGYHPANIRRKVAAGELYVAGRTRRNEHVFPEWQFAGSIEGGGAPLPGLSVVLKAIPTDYHPADVAEFMTSPQELLNDRSPAQWLASGGAVGPVVRLASELGWQ